MPNTKLRKRISKGYNDTVRIGPRISRSVYMLAKYVYGMKEMNMESRIEALLKKDLEYLTKQKWFSDFLATKAGQDFELLKLILDGSKQASTDITNDDQFSGDWMKED